MNLFKTTTAKIIKTFSIILLQLVLILSSFSPFIFSSVNPSPVLAEAASCNSSPANNATASTASYKSRIGGVALDQAAKFLANMSDISSAYYDPNLDRIVFVGKTTTTAPQFDKDDLAVAIKSVIFNHQIPYVSLEGTNPDPNLQNAIYSKGIENTRLGNILIQADYKLKSYVIGTDENGQIFHSNVSGYASHGDRYYSTPGVNPSGYVNSNRFWLTPKEITLARDDNAKSFTFQSTTMQLRSEPLSSNNDPRWDQTAQDFANHFTQNYDAFASESQIFNDAKVLAKVTGVIKWINDSGIATDFQWARDYAPKVVQTPKTFPIRNSKIYLVDGVGHFQVSGGADFLTPNTYAQDTAGNSSSLKTAAQTIPTTKEDVHWTFTKDSQEYQAVAVAADAFRTLGSFNTSVTDLSFPTTGDLTLAFQRQYSSYSGGQYGVGRGWNIFPAALYDNLPGTPAHTFSCTNGVYPKALSIVTQSGGFESFKINDCNIGYVPDDVAYHSKISKNSDGTFQVILKDQTTINFDANYLLINIKDKNNNAVSYNYDSSGKLLSISDSKNHQINLSYGPNNLITSTSDWSGRTVNYTYDGDGNLLTAKDPNGNITTYTYDNNFELVSVKDRNSQLVLTNSYTDEAKLASQQDAANVKQSYSYDKVNRIITQTDNQTPSRIQKTTYDTKARVLQQLDTLSNKTDYTYGAELLPLAIKDKNGNILTNTYDSNGNVLTVTYPDNKKITYQYDAKNRLTKITDERYGTPGKDTTNTYDSLGNLLQTNEAGQIAKYTYDSTGEALTSTDPLNHIFTWTRDNFGNKLTEKDAVNNTTNFEYDAIGRLKKKTDANAKITTITYDNNGSVLTMNDGVGTTTNLYDKENRLIKLTLPDNTVNEFSYNNLGSLLTTKDPALNISSYGYDAYQNLVSQQDALNKITNNTYDGLNRQTQSTTPLGNAYKYQYDGNGNITKRTDGNNSATTYLYDALNRITKITYPNASIVTFAYDNRGNRTQMVDSVGTSSYVYDNFNRLTQSTNAYGKILKYTYDNANNLKTITYPESYDNHVVTYGYDNNNRLATVTDWNSGVVSYIYNSNGTLASRTLPNGIKTTYTYDNANRVSNISHAKGTTVLAKYDYTRDPVGNIITSAESGSFVGAAQAVSYIYDSLGRITKATYPGNKTFEYTYDKAGNRLTQKVDGATVTTYTYDNDYRLIQKNNLTSFTYDNNGNQTKKPSGTLLANPIFSFDFENRMIGHTTAAGNAYDYTYDGLGNRLRKHFSTAVTRYIYDNSGPQARVMATSGDQNYAGTFWIYGLGLISDGSDFSSTRNYYLEDGSGNTRFMTSSNGAMQSAANYDPFGNIRTSSGILPDFEFNKQQLDSESNMYFLRARYYDPETGRFISRDPVKGLLTSPQTQNPYAYSANNPINLSDPSGEFVQYIQPVLNLLTNIGTKCAQMLCGDGDCTNEAVVVQKGSNAVYQNVPKNVDYVGITNNILRRTAEQAGNGRAIQQISGLENLSRTDARAVEQALIDGYGLMDKGGQLTNKINSISPNNPIYPQAVKKGYDILKDIGYEFNK